MSDDKTNLLFCTYQKLNDKLMNNTLDISYSHYAAVINRFDNADYDHEAYAAISRLADNDLVADKQCAAFMLACEQCNI